MMRPRRYRSSASMADAVKLVLVLLGMVQPPDLVQQQSLCCVLQQGLGAATMLPCYAAGNTEAEMWESTGAEQKRRLQVAAQACAIVQAAEAQRHSKKE